MALTALLLAAGITGCTRTIDDGQYGTLQIGDGKAATLTRLEDYGIDIASIEPAVSGEIQVTNPTSTTLLALDGAGWRWMALMESSSGSNVTHTPYASSLTGTASRGHGQR